MAPKAKPYDQFGPYILFKRLESDSLGDLWRAARIEGSNQLGPVVALRRLSGGDRPAMLQSATDARAIVPLLNGTTFVKSQTIDVEDSVPFIAWDYAGGRSLRHVVDRARGGGGTAPNPIPLDQAILMTERIALSLSTLSEMRYGSERLTHGAVIPQFIWVTDDGDIRVAGQQLGKGITASLKDSTVSAEIGRYFAPEYRGGPATKSSEIYSLGAILFLLVTGAEPPDPLSVTAFAAVIRAAKTMAGQPIPLEIRTILDKSLVLDPASRYASIGDMKQALDALSSKYPATSFNLAFYLSTLLKKEFETEALDREKESKVSVAAYTAIHVPGPTFASAIDQRTKSRTPLIAAAAIAAVAIAGVAAYMMMKPSPAGPASRTPAAVAPPPKLAPILSTPALASTVPPNAMPAAQTVATDPKAAKKAFEDAVNQKLQSEMLKLQSNFTRELQQKKSKNAPVVTEAPAPTPQAAEAGAPSAAALDERRLTTARPEPAPQPAAPAAAQPQPQPSAPQPVAAPAPVQQAVREGDVVDVSDLDTMPHPLRPPMVAYPPLALRQRAETSVIVTALVSENGDVLDVRVLRGDPRFGFNDAALRALRNVKFSPAIKDGKRVKTWFPQTINFKL